MFFRAKLRGAMIMRKVVCSLFLFFFTSTLLEASTSIGRVVRVESNAVLVSGVQKTSLQPGMELQSGDRIETNKTGLVQLVFTDETKIVIGPNASMTLDVTMMRGRAKADSFAVKTLGGSFRFISGKSRKKAYKITTPTATMGIRGTEFDFWVADHRQTSVVILKGAVRLCGGAGNCKSFTGSCSYASTNSQGQVGIVAPGKDALAALNAGFPFLLDQTNLADDFQTDTGACGNYLPAVKRTPNFETTPFDQPEASETPEPSAPDKPDRPDKPAPSRT